MPHALNAAAPMLSVVLPTSPATAHAAAEVARALLAFVCEEARNNGMRAVELQVVPSQQPALALYRSLGFRTNDRMAHVLEL